MQARILQRANFILDVSPKWLSPLLCTKKYQNLHNYDVPHFVLHGRSPFCNFTDEFQIYNESIERGVFTFTLTNISTVLPIFLQKHNSVSVA